MRKDYKVTLVDDAYLFESDKKFKVRFIRQFTGGKSGDKVIEVQIDSEKFILKIFKGKNENEIDKHLEFIDLFRNSEYIPCPLIYSVGTLYGDLQGLYVFMEYLDPPYELDSYIASICEKKEKKTKELYSILMQLFYILGMMQVNHFSHCDLHTKNIILVKGQKSSIDMYPVIGEHIEYPIGEFKVKLIDFGLAGRHCKKIRNTSIAINRLKMICGGFPNIIEMIKGEIGLLGKSNVDVNFFCRIVEIFALFDKKIKRINMNYLWRQSKDLYKVDKNSKKISKQKIFRKIFYEMIDHI